MAKTDNLNSLIQFAIIVSKSAVCAGMSRCNSRIDYHTEIPPVRTDFCAQLCPTVKGPELEINSNRAAITSSRPDIYQYLL